jgi:hypothetical protein
MAWKCIRTLMLVVMELVILILEVQTNDLAPTYFSPSVLPIRYLHSSKPEKVREPLHKCLGNEIKGCEQLRAWPRSSIQFEICIFKGFTKCSNPVKHGKEWPRHFSQCLIDCKQHKHQSMVVACYIRCHNKHVKKH